MALYVISTELCSRKKNFEIFILCVEKVYLFTCIYMEIVMLQIILNSLTHTLTLTHTHSHTLKHTPTHTHLQVSEQQYTNCNCSLSTCLLLANCLYTKPNTFDLAFQRNSADIADAVDFKPGTTYYFASEQCLMFCARPAELPW